MGLFISIENVVKNEFMDSQLHDIAYLIQFKDSINTKVSKVPISWHLDHSLKVINITHDILRSSNPDVYKKHFSLTRTVSFNLGYIPRGKVNSPTSVLPPDSIQTKDVLSQLDLARENLQDLDNIDDNANFMHPIFGQLNKKQTKRFLKVHTQHHLKIIADILKND